MPNSQIYVRDTTNNKNVPLQVDGSNKLAVSDSVAQSSLSSINSTLSGGLTVADSTSAGKLDTINSTLGGTLTVSDTTAQSSLSSINSALGGSLTVSDSTAQSSLSSINSALGGSLTVADSTAAGKLDTINTTLSGTLTTTQGVSRTNGNIASSQSVTSGDVSASVDSNLYKNAAIFGNLGASGNVIIQISNDNSTWHDSHHEFYSNYSGYDFSGEFATLARYWRVKYAVSGTVSVRYALVA
jgi:hypothetical protein